MATTNALTLRDPPIKLQPSYNEEDLVYVTVSHTFAPGAAGGTEKRKASLLKLTETVGATDFVELLCRTILDFEDAAQNERLHLTTGPALFAKFRECLGPVYQADFDVLQTVHPQTVAGFGQAINAFIALYVPPTATMDQMQCIRTLKKPYKMSVRTWCHETSFDFLRTPKNLRNDSKK